MIFRIAALFVISACGASVCSAQLYRWVDGQGRVHYGDTVPKAHQKEAKSVEVIPPTVQQHREATSRVYAERAKAEAMRRGREKALAPEGPGSSNDTRTPQSVVALPGTGKPSLPVSPSEKKRQCEEDWRLFEESSRCFGPYRLANGAIKAEAFQRCGTPVAMPELCEK